MQVLSERQRWKERTRLTDRISRGTLETDGSKLHGG